MKISLKITSPELTLFDARIYEVIVPTTNGDRAILPQHTPYVLPLKAGVVKLRYQKSDSTFSDYYAVGDGLVSISKSLVHVLVSTAEHADSIDKLRAIEAVKEAEEVRRNTTDHLRLAQATALIERNTARIAITRHNKSK